MARVGSRGSPLLAWTPFARIISQTQTKLSRLTWLVALRAVRRDRLAGLASALRQLSETNHRHTLLPVGIASSEIVERELLNRNRSNHPKDAQRSVATPNRSGAGRRPISRPDASSTVPQAVARLRINVFAAYNTQKSLQITLLNNVKVTLSL